MIEKALEHFAEKGYKPDLVIDVGASNGCETMRFWRIFGNCPAILVEPNSRWDKQIENFKKIYRDNIRVFRKAAGMEFREGLLLTPNGVPQLASIVDHKTPDHPEDHYELTVIDRLDNMVRLTEWADFKHGIMKIDVQGYQEPVVAGGADCLQRCDIVIMETNGIFKPCGEASLTFKGAIEWMSMCGFQLWAIDKIVHRQFDAGLWEVDCLFVRQNLIETCDLFMEPSYEKPNWR